MTSTKISRLFGVLTHDDKTNVRHHLPSDTGATSKTNNNLIISVIKSPRNRAFLMQLIVAWPIEKFPVF